MLTPEEGIDVLSCHPKMYYGCITGWIVLKNQCQLIPFEFSYMSSYMTRMIMEEYLLSSSATSASINQEKNNSSFSLAWTGTRSLPPSTLSLFKATQQHRLNRNDNNKTGNSNSNNSKITSMNHPFYKGADTAAKGRVNTMSSNLHHTHHRVNAQSGSANNVGSNNNDYHHHNNNNNNNNHGTNCCITRPHDRECLFYNAHSNNNNISSIYDCNCSCVSYSDVVDDYVDDNYSDNNIDNDGNNGDSNNNTEISNSHTNSTTPLHPSPTPDISYYQRHLILHAIRQLGFNCTHCSIPLDGPHGLFACTNLCNPCALRKFRSNNEGYVEGTIRFYLSGNESIISKGVVKCRIKFSVVQYSVDCAV